MGNYGGNTIRARQVFRTDDGARLAPGSPAALIGQDDYMEFAGIDPGGAGVTYGPNGIVNGTAYYTSTSGNAGNSATAVQDLGKIKAYKVTQQAYLDTSDYYITRDQAITRLNPGLELD